MSYKNNMFNQIKPKIISTILISVFLSACGSSDDDDETNTGYIQLYNSSSNSPGIILTVEKDDDDDYVENTYSGVKYGKVSGLLVHEIDTYDIDLSWQDEDDQNDLEVIYENSLSITNDVIKLITITEDITSPQVVIYDIPLVDDDNDYDDDLFNLRLLNLHPNAGSIDIYFSEKNETFNEAILLGQYNYTQLSDNQKINQDDYIFYITQTGSQEILFQSNEISYQSTSQSILVIRENNGPGTSQFSIDKVTTTGSSVEYADADSEAQFRVYNGISEHELLPEYNGLVDLYINEIDQSPELPSLGFGEFSNSFLSNFGDYAISLTATDTGEIILENNLLTLDINSDKSVFFYLFEEEVDEDNDGEFDENGDGIVDEWEVKLNTIIVENSHNKSIYEHNINIINLVDNFNYLNVYFVRSDETIDTANYFAKATYVKPKNITLHNNTYKVYVIGKEDNSDLILATDEIILNESNFDQFLILEESTDSPSGYKLSFHNQINPTN